MIIDLPITLEQRIEKARSARIEEDYDQNIIDTIDEFNIGFHYQNPIATVLVYDQLPVYVELTKAELRLLFQENIYKTFNEVNLRISVGTLFDHTVWDIDENGIVSKDYINSEYVFMNPNPVIKNIVTVDNGEGVYLQDEILLDAQGRIFFDVRETTETSYNQGHDKLIYLFTPVGYDQAVTYEPHRFIELENINWTNPPALTTTEPLLMVEYYDIELTISISPINFVNVGQTVNLVVTRSGSTRAFTASLGVEDTSIVANTPDYVNFNVGETTKTIPIYIASEGQCDIWIWTNGARGKELTLTASLGAIHGIVGTIEANDTLESNASLTTLSVLNVIEEDDTLDSISFNTTMNGNLAVTEEDDTLESNGILSLNALVDITEEDDSPLIRGINVFNYAVVDYIEDDDILNTVTLLSLNASLTKTEDDDTLFSSGKLGQGRNMNLFLRSNLFVPVR